MPVVLVRGTHLRTHIRTHTITHAHTHPPPPTHTPTATHLTHPNQPPPCPSPTHPTHPFPHLLPPTPPHPLRHSPLRPQTHPCTPPTPSLGAQYKTKLAPGECCNQTQGVPDVAAVSVVSQAWRRCQHEHNTGFKVCGKGCKLL